MNTVSKELELPGAFMLGAAAVPSRIVGMNAEVNYLYYQLKHSSCSNKNSVLMQQGLQYITQLLVKTHRLS